MATVSIKKFKLIITVSKIIGLMNFCCVVNNGVLCRHMDSTYYLFLEGLRTFVFLICSYHIMYNMGMKYILLEYNVTLYWMTVIAARTQETRMIKFINGVVEFDRKLSLCDASMRPAAGHSRPSSDDRARVAAAVGVAGFAAYHAAFLVYFMSHHKAHYTEVSHFTDVLFSSPNIVASAVVFTTCFYLCHVGRRFGALDALWRRLPQSAAAHSIGKPPAAAADDGRWTDDEITAVAECVRLLHAQLCVLLGLFGIAYGPAILVCFTFTFVHTLLEMFLIVAFDGAIKLGFVPFAFYLQYVVFKLSILCVASWADQKKLTIVSHLRSMRISEMPIETKLQVKMFMSQISICESNDLSAFGFFKINLELVLSILALMTTGIATLIQMKDYPFMIQLNKIMKTQFKNIK